MKSKFNPLASILEKMKINYMNGGFFSIKYVKWGEHGQMFLDYDILIASIKQPI
jgi:hypothetical protein